MASALQMIMSRPPPAWLEISIEEARGLPKKNKTNPFCEVRVGDQYHRTSTRKNTGNPVWRERLTFRVFDLSSFLKIQIMDKGMRQDSIIGLVEERISRLENQHIKEEWLPLFPSTSNLNSKTNVGEVHVVMQLIFTPSSASLKLKKRPILALDSFLNELTLAGEIGTRVNDEKEKEGSLESPQSPMSPAFSPPHSPSLSPPMSPRSEREASPNELTLLNELGGLASTVIPTRMNTCDILLFSSKHAFSYATKLLTNSKWDHVGLVVNFKGVLTVLEATSGAGVQINHLDDRLRSFLEKGTRVGLRRLQPAVTPEQKTPLWNFINQMMGRPYEKNLFELAKAVGPSSGSTTSRGETAQPGKDPLASVFCSQLVAAALQDACILDPEACASEFAPADFATSTFDTHLSQNCSFSPLIIFTHQGRSDSKRKHKRSNSIDGVPE